MNRKAEAAPLENGLETALADGYATVHELEMRSMQLQRHCHALVVGGAESEQIHAVMRAHRALRHELKQLRKRLMQMRAEDANLGEGQVS
jgi:hypothetical protein